MLPEWQSSGPAFEDNANVQDYIAKRSDTSGSNNLMNSNFNYNQFKQEESNEVRSGYIKSIELIDFMCHRHLTIELHEKINFLTGNNGSGKSAILTALSLCLGGRARSTQRATSAENLIREGANLAKIRISLSNKGANPYPSVRGPVIIIERKILRTGSSEYRIFDSQKQNLGARKEDVNAICDHFGIQIDNPLVILTQETAKRFLASSKPSDLYEFFMKSTQLEQLQFDYIFSQNRLADAKLSLERSVQRLEPLSENIAKLERKLAEIEQLRMAEVKIKLLRQELVWAHVTKKEKDQKKYLSDTLKLKNRVIELDSQIESNRLTISKLEEHVKELEDEITEKLDQIQPLVKQKNLLLETDSSESNKMLLIESDIKESVIEINNNKKLLESISRKISEEAKFKGKDENCSEILRSKLEEIDQKTIVLNTEQANFNIQKSEYLNEKEQITVKLDDLSSQIDEKSRELKKTQDYIRRMENSKNNRLRLFDEKMPDVVAEIEKNRSFRFKPVGPAGIHIQLKDDHWVVPMNAIIGNDLEAFIVDNTDDSRLLRSILRKYNLNNPIIQLKFNDIDELDISKGRPQNDLLTALDVLNIDHLAVKKMLIMDCKIEKSVLITEYKEAMLVAKKKPVNVNAIFTEKYRIKFTANTTSTSAFYSNAQRPNFFTNIEKNINDAARIKTQLENWISESTNLAFELNANVTSLTSTINEIDLEIFARTRQLHDLRTKSREIQDKLVRNQDSGTTSIYEIEKSKALADLKICEEEKMRLDQQYDRIKENISTSQNQIYQLDLQIKSIESSHRRTLAQLSDIEKQKTVLFRENDKVTREVEKISSAVLTSLASEAKITEELAEMVQQASSMYPRTVVSSTIEDIDKELQFQQDCVRNKELYSKIDPESLKTEYYHLVEQRRNEERGIIENGDLITKLELSIKERLDSWHYFRKCVSKQSAIDFIMLLNPRGYNGSLEYKHQESELHITIIPPSQQQAIRTSFSKNIYKKPKKDKKMLNRLSQKQFVEKHDVKQLSGGEKSYGTGCFLCSLWSAIGSPTRCLDEFDVFMDSINREAMLDLMLRKARESRLQFLMITPNAIPDKYTSLNDVKIHRLNDPQRGQTVII